MHSKKQAGHLVFLSSPAAVGVVGAIWRECIRQPPPPPTYTDVVYHVTAYRVICGCYLQWGACWCASIKI